MKVIAGVESLTDGEILVDGQTVTIRDKDDAVAHGIGIFLQELNLFPELTVADNVSMGREPCRIGIDVDKRAVLHRTRELLGRLERDIDPETRLGFLRIGQQQIVEIAKALGEDARILVLDEPTSALSVAEVEVLFRVIDELKVQGEGIVYVSHRLEELFRVGDYISVRRDGAITGSRPMAGVDVPWIVQVMIGGKSKDYSEDVRYDFGDEVFRAEQVSVPKAGGGFPVQDAFLFLRAGGILGFYGIVGAGRSEFLECIMAQLPQSTGSCFVEVREMRESFVAGRIARGIVLVPQDRKRDGLVQIMPIREHPTMFTLRSFTWSIHLDLAEEAGSRGRIHSQADDQGDSSENPVSSFAGGNQQKAVIGRALMTGPKLVLMEEPMRGINVGAKAEIYRTMCQGASEGIGIILVTSELEEVLNRSNRILATADGRITGEFPQERNAAEVIAAAAPDKTWDRRRAE